MLAVLVLLIVFIISQGTGMEVLADQRVDEVSISLEELQNDIDINRLRHHVYVLASQEMKGRDVGSNEAERAISYIENKFKSYGLQPWFGEDYKQPITTGAGANVVALLPGFDPKLRHELVLVTAHHDHLGIREGLIYPGADDNISSVALMLETARILAKHSRVVKRSILFISFDAEEKPEGGTDKMGSGFFVNQLSNDNRQRIVLMIGMDLMAGEVIPALPGALFIMGAEKSLHLSRLIQSRTPIDGLNPVPLGLAMIEAVPYCPWCQHSVSDYDSFRQADIPFVFLSTGRSQYYHTPADTPSSLHYKKIERNAAYLLGLTLGAANDLEWINDYDHHAQDQSTDIASVASVLDAVLKQPPEGIRWDTFKSLHKAQDTVTEFSEKTDPLSWFEYRRLQSISLQMQCAVAKPSWRICPWF